MFHVKINTGLSKSVSSIVTAKLCANKLRKVEPCSIPGTYTVTCDMEREVRFHEESHLRNNSSYARTPCSRLL